MGFGSERLHTSLLQVLLPPGNRRGRSADQPGYLPNSPALLEQPASNAATYFQCFSTTFGSHSECYYTSLFVPIKIRRSIIL